MSGVVQIYTLHRIDEDGLPDMDRLVNRVAFIWDGNIVSGWPADETAYGERLWASSDDALGTSRFAGVTHWIEFPVPVHQLADTAEFRRLLEESTIASPAARSIIPPNWPALQGEPMTDRRSPGIPIVLMVDLGESRADEIESYTVAAIPRKGECLTRTGSTQLWHVVEVQYDLDPTGEWAAAVYVVEL